MKLREEQKTSTVESLLGALSLQAMSGYEMRQFMESSTGNFWSESFGQIYPALKRMVAEGLVTEDAPIGDGSTAKKVYRITAAGEERLRSWLKMPARRRPNRNELLLKLFYGNSTEPEVLMGHVAAWREEYASDLRRYEAMGPALEAEHGGHPGLPYWRMTLRYGIAEARMLIAWCDETIAELERAGSRN